MSSSSLEQVPEELVVDLVVELDFRRFDEGSQGAGQRSAEACFRSA